MALLLTMLLSLKMFEVSMKNIFILLLAGSLYSCMPTDYTKKVASNLNFSDNTREPTSEETVVSEVTSLDLRTGDRFYIASVLNEVFGANYNAGNRVYDNVVKNQGVFGGGCDLYEKSFKGATSGTLEFPWQNCFDSNWNSDQILQSTTLREGWRVRTCELIIKDNPTAVTYAFNKANVDSSGAPSKDGLNSLYKLFYPLDEIPDSVANIMLSWEGEISDNEEFWEASLLTFCISPEWQIP